MALQPVEKRRCARLAHLAPNDAHTENKPCWADERWHFAHLPVPHTSRCRFVGTADI